MIESREECLLLGMIPLSASSNIHFRLTGPRGEGLKVIGESDLLLAHLLVGELEGEGEKERLGTGICILGEKHCFPGTDDLKIKLRKERIIYVGTSLLNSARKSQICGICIKLEIQPSLLTLKFFMQN